MALVVSAAQPKWLESILDSYQQDAHAQKLLTELALTGSNEHGYSLQEGVIIYKGRIWLGANGEAHKAILLSLHGSALGGHSGIQGTYHKIKKMFYWPHMKKDITSYVKACSTCQQAKSESKITWTLAAIANST
jgi:hypothetical protein